MTFLMTIYLLHDMFQNVCSVKIFMMNVKFFLTTNTSHELVGNSGVIVGRALPLENMNTALAGNMRWKACTPIITRINLDQVGFHLVVAPILLISAKNTSRTGATLSAETVSLIRGLIVGISTFSDSRTSSYKKLDHFYANL